MAELPWVLGKCSKNYSWISGQVVPRLSRKLDAIVFTLVAEGLEFGSLAGVKLITFVLFLSLLLNSST